MTSSFPAPGPVRASCGCPEDEGLVRHQKGTCTDPVVAQLGWYFEPAGDAPAPGPVGAPGWLAEDKAAAEKLLTNARSVREELAQPSMLGRLAPGWGFWPGVERAAIRWGAAVAALEAVLGFHRPIQSDWGISCSCWTRGGSHPLWPCAEVMEIAGELTKAGAALRDTQGGAGDG